MGVAVREQPDNSRVSGRENLPKGRNETVPGQRVRCLLDKKPFGDEDKKERRENEPGGTPRVAENKLRRPPAFRLRVRYQLWREYAECPPEQGGAFPAFPEQLNILLPYRTGSAFFSLRGSSVATGRTTLCRSPPNHLDGRHSGWSFAANGGIWQKCTLDVAAAMILPNDLHGACVPYIMRKCAHRSRQTSFSLPSNAA